MALDLANQRTRRRIWPCAIFGLALATSVALLSGCQTPFVSNPPISNAARASAEVEWTSSLSNSPSESTDAKIVQAVAQRADEPQADTAGPAADAENTIDLAVAFQLAGVDNPTINLAREAVREAVAKYRGAQVLLLPNLTVGGNFRAHGGNLQAGSGIIRDVDSQSLYAGAGARALAAETVAFPGIRLFSHLGDAIYEPLAARQQVETRRAVAAATENRVLLDVAAAYFELIGAEMRLEALRKSEAELQEIERLTRAYAKAGQGREGDHRRAEANFNLLRRQMHETEGAVASASARLAGLLSLDPSVRLRSPGGTVELLKLIDESQCLESLIQQALLNRPEVRARLLEIAEARTRVRQERVRPLLPTLSIGFSAGTFGGGSNLTAAGITQPGGSVQVSPWFGHFDGRTDFDVFAVWTLQNSGAGNRASTRKAEAVVGELVAELDRTNNQIRREVAEALADAQSAARQVGVARSQLTAAEEGFREEMIRIKQTIGRPLETIDSFRLLLAARQEVVRSVIEHNAAQYRLWVAVGFSPLQSPGD
jgi:outer membrane protein TolC